MLQLLNSERVLKFYVGRVGVQIVSELYFTVTPKCEAETLIKSSFSVAEVPVKKEVYKDMGKESRLEGQ